MASVRIGFIGAGNMAQALAKGMVSAGLTKPQHIIASSPKTDQHLLDQMAAIGCSTTHNNAEATAHSDVVVISVKPAVVPRVLHDIKPSVTSARPLVTSVALGVTLATMEGVLPTESRVIRVMPNTPALVQLGASVFTRGTHATDADATLTHRLLSAVGECDEVPETFLDAITGLSGAGPAYMYLVVEALADGGVKMGLPRPLAQKLAAQTMMGAAKMVMATGKHPGLLKDEVCSPGGCTIQGVHALEKGGIRAAFIDAVHAATTTSISTASGK
ncbi:pyrroline-5-carboxylate reductase 3-like [Penaeus monodon]|uniref:pyrroline-5-carboxylate reductase 3-like n=1 Tax=Penaeus monodon TaxID=6687 RepID=UPI0018A76C2E|nr:pyrroline-5-carboxylate reductase 3-like [Penaeus monodon]